MLCRIIALAIVVTWVPVVLGQQISAPIEVAPKCAGTRSQVWASVAYAEKAKRWLVVWREGYLNEATSEIWCARVSADGTPLDPAGLRITHGPGLKDMPRVASDGQDFLVVWEDLRNGKDWDVLAARVTAEGKVLDPDGIAVAVRPRNQCRPDVGFAAGYYVVVWQELIGEGEPNTAGTAYVVRAIRLHRDGKLAEPQPIELARLEKENHAFGPVIACWHKQVLTAFYVTSFASGNDYLARRAIDVETGCALGKQPEPSRTSNKNPIRLPSGDALRSAVLAMNKDEAVTVLVGNWLEVWRMDCDGTNPQHVVSLARSTASKLADVRYFPRISLAASEQAYFLVTEWPRRIQPAGRLRMEIRGWRLGRGGQALDDAEAGLVVAADSRHDQLLPAAAPGPQGVFLIVYSERRGPDDLKVLARLVDTK